MTESVTPFQIDVPQGELDDLRYRLNRTRWPDAGTVSDWSQGVPLDKLRSLCDYWANSYDWRRCESMLNAFNQYRPTFSK